MLNDLYDASDDAFRAAYVSLKDELRLWRATIDANVRRARQLGIDGKAVATDGGLEQ